MCLASEPARGREGSQPFRHLGGLGSLALCRLCSASVPPRLLEASVTQVQTCLFGGDWVKQYELSQPLMREAVWRCPGGGQETSQVLNLGFIS